MRIKIKYRFRKKIFFEKYRDKQLQKQNNRYLNYKELHRSFVELENELKTLEEILSGDDSKNNLKIFKRNLFQTT